MRTGLSILCSVFINVSASVLVSVSAMALDIEDVTTESGVTAWVVQVPDVPVISLEVSFAAGIQTEDPSKAGLRNVLADMMLEGAGDLDGQAFKARLERLGIGLSVEPSKDTFQISFTTPSMHAGEAFELLNKALTELHVKDADLDRVVARQTASLQRSQERPGHMASRALMAQLYPDHPYSRSSSGTLDGLAAVTADDVRSYAATWLTTQDMTLALVGDMDLSTAKDYLDTALKGVSAQAPDLKPLVSVAAQINPEITKVDMDVPQASLQFALPAVTRNHPDWIPIALVNRVLGSGGMVSRLFTEVRRERGLAYSVGSSVVPFKASGLIIGQTGTANETVEQALSVIRDVLADLAENGLSEQELQDAKSSTIGALPLSLDTNEALAGMIMSMQLNDLGRDYMDRRAEIINTISMDDIQRVARTYFDPKHMTVVVAGAPKGL